MNAFCVYLVCSKMYMLVLSTGFIEESLIGQLIIYFC